MRVIPQTIPELVRRGAEAYPDAEALRTVESDVISYSDLDKIINFQTDRLSRMGLRPGDNVAIVLPNGPGLAQTFLAVTGTATAAPLNERLKRPEFEYYLSDLNAKALIIQESDLTVESDAYKAACGLDIPVIVQRFTKDGAARAIELTIPSESKDQKPVRASGVDTALVLHTSGTTSAPKIVPLSHSNLVTSARNVSEVLRLRTDDVCLNIMPLFHIHGLVAALLSSLSAGSSVVCSPGFHGSSFLGWLDILEPTWYTGVPTMHQNIIRRVELDNWTPPASGRMRFIRSSSASLAPSVLHKLESIFSVCVVEAYGMTEASHQMTSNPLSLEHRKPGSVGRCAGPEVDIRDDDGNPVDPREIGEVVIRGPSVMHGYLDKSTNEHAFWADDWFRTGDQGYVDEDGYLFLTGRLKELINRGGESISPREIDEALLSHPAVSQAVAFSIPDSNLGEEVGAAIIPVPGTALTERELIEFLEPRLSFAKTPKRIEIVDEIPKGPTGKLQRIGLAAKLGIRDVHNKSEVANESERESEDPIVERISELWKEVLSRDVGTQEQFLDAGGDSIAATILVYRIGTEFEIEIPLVRLFNAPTVYSQAVLVSELIREKSS